jgi:hypothetical protein
VQHHDGLFEDFAFVFRLRKSIWVLSWLEFCPGLRIEWMKPFVWFFNFYWLTGSFDLVIFSRWLTWGYPAVSDIGFLLAYREYILQEYC